MKIFKRKIKLLWNKSFKCCFCLKFILEILVHNCKRPYFNRCKLWWIKMPVWLYIVIQNLSVILFKRKGLPIRWMLHFKSHALFGGNNFLGGGKKMYISAFCTRLRKPLLFSIVFVTWYFPGLFTCMFT